MVENVNISRHPRMHIADQFYGKFSFIEGLTIHLAFLGLSEVETLIDLGLAVHVMHEAVGILDVDRLPDHRCRDERLVHATNLINQRFGGGDSVGLACRNSGLDVDTDVSESFVGPNQIGPRHHWARMEGTAEFIR